MKQKKLKNNKVVRYGFADPEMYRQLRRHRHTAIPDKKKQLSKRICRSSRSTGNADFYLPVLIQYC